MILPKRKHPRLKEYDYSQHGSYFITICVKNRAKLLGTLTLGRDDHIPPSIQLTSTGLTVKQFVESINTTYEDVLMETYVIMPNQIHHLIKIDSDSTHRNEYSNTSCGIYPTIPSIVKSFKTKVWKQIGYSIWQESFTITS